MENLDLGSVKSFVDTLWVIDCAILVFIMQAGFMCMETGLSRYKNSINVALKNAADFGVAVVIFWIFGFGLMFGESYKGIIGTDLFFFKTNVAEYMTYFVFQAMFVATAATIISGAVAERMKFNGYLIITILATGIIYPIVGHWAWSSSYLNNMDPVNQLLTVTNEIKSTGWLTDIGFVDFAGSTIVHSVGGWIALAAVIILGPRIGKYSEANKGKFTGSSFPLAVLGTLILWFGWFGFNGGSNGAMDEAVPLILINTFLAAAFGLLTGLSRYKNSINVALKNAADFGVSVVIFWIFGFGIMFGTSYNGFFGTDLFFFKTDKADYMTYFVFQAMFVATAATIISGAVAERMKFNGYLIMTVLATGIIYPIVGHWAWSSSYLTGSVKSIGWLSDLGFVDFAGSTIVHSVGGWIALAAVIILGPRIG